MVAICKCVEKIDYEGENRNYEGEKGNYEQLRGRQNGT